MSRTLRTTQYLLIIATSLLCVGCGSNSLTNRRDRIESVDEVKKIAALVISAFEQRSAPFNSFDYIGQTNSTSLFCKEGGSVTSPNRKADLMAP
jgi:hypothetical protein